MAFPAADSSGYDKRQTKNIVIYSKYVIELIDVFLRGRLQQPFLGRNTYSYVMLERGPGQITRFVTTTLNDDLRC